MSLEKIALYLLLCIGLLQTIGHITGSKELEQIGYVSAAAPTALNYSQISPSGLEDFHQYKIKYTTTNGIEGKILLNKEQFSKVEGPYQYRLIYRLALDQLIHPQNDRENLLAKVAIQFGLCHKGPIAKAVITNKSPIDQFIVIATRQDNQQIITKEVSCP